MLLERILYQREEEEEVSCRCVTNCLIETKKNCMIEEETCFVIKRNKRVTERVGLMVKIWKDFFIIINSYRTPYEKKVP